MLPDVHELVLALSLRLAILEEKVAYLERKNPDT